MNRRRSSVLLVTCLLAGASAVAVAEPEIQPKVQPRIQQKIATAPASPGAPGNTAAPAAQPAAARAAAAAGAANAAASAPVAAPVPGSAARPSSSGGPGVAAAAPAASTAAPIAVALPKPAPELDEMKVLEGHWRCDGRAPASHVGPEHAYKSTWRFKRDLDNFWWAAEYQQTKAKNHPMPMKARGYLTYDAASKTFLLVGVDNMGGSSNESTTGWTGDVVTLAGDANMAGKKVPYREVITKKGNREFTWRGEMKMDGDWVTLGEDRCKK